MPRIRPQNNYKTTLATSIGPTDATITVVTPPVQTSGFMVIEPNTDNIEIIKYTGVSGNDLTGCVRGLSLTDSSTETPVPANQKSHAAGRAIEMTNATYYMEQLVSIEGDETITGEKIFPAGGGAKSAKIGSVYSAPTDPLEIPSKQYVDSEISAVVAGAVPAFAVQQDGADPSLNIQIGSGYFMNGNTPVSFAGASGVAMTPSTTNYVMIDNTGTVIVNTSGFLEDHLPLAEVTTDPTDITAIMDKRSWLTLPSDDQAITRAYTYGDTIAIGDVLYLDTADSKWKKADASAAATADPTYGVALDAGVDTDTNKRVQIAGVVTTVSGITTAGIQYVSDTAGEVSNTQGTYKKVIGFSADGSSMILQPVQRIEDLSGSNVTTNQLNSLVGIGMTAGEIMDGTSNPIAVYVNSSDGKVYKTDASFLDERSNAFFGFITSSVVANDPVTVTSAGDLPISALTLSSAVSSTLDQHNDGISSPVSIWGINSLLRWYSQAFQIGEAVGNIEKVEIYTLNVVGAPVCDIHIYAIDVDGKPTGAALASVTGISPTNGGLTVATLGTPLVVNQGEQYAIVVEPTTADGSNSFAIGGSGALQTQAYNMVRGGDIDGFTNTGYTSTDSGSTWNGAENAVFNTYFTLKTRTVGDSLYLSETPGEFSLERPTGVGASTQICARILSSSKMLIQRNQEERLLGATIISANTIASCPVYAAVPPRAQKAIVSIRNGSTRYNESEVTLIKGNKNTGTIENDPGAGTGISYTASWIGNVIEIDMSVGGGIIEDSTVTFFTQ